MHTVFEPVVMLYVGHKERKEQHIQTENRNFGERHEEKHPAYTQKCKKNHHQFVRKPFVLEKTDACRYRLQLFGTQVVAFVLQ